MVTEKPELTEEEDPPLVDVDPPQEDEVAQEKREEKPAVPNVTKLNQNSNSDEDFRQRVKEYQKLFNEIKKEVGKVVVGQAEIIESLLEALICHGNCLVEGIPGIAKTLLVKSLAKVTGCKFSRIQFTPDLLPSDIVGITTYDENRGFYTIKGPIFANFVLGDEINRAPAKVGRYAGEAGYYWKDLLPPATALLCHGNPEPGRADGNLSPSRSPG